MKERPILFSAPMVRAILEGRKTVTRRVVNGIALRWLAEGFTPGFVAHHENHVCQFGQPGDRLWVRETTVRFTGCPSNGKPWGEVPFILSPDADSYKALLHVVGNQEHITALESAAACVTVPSIFMPRWASRILLEITSVRIERLQAMKYEDFRAEGMETALHGVHAVGRQEFVALWDSINEGRGFGWNANPWVWVIEFRRIEA